MFVGGGEYDEGEEEGGDVGGFCVGGGGGLFEGGGEVGAGVREVEGLYPG